MLSNDKDLIFGAVLMNKILSSGEPNELHQASHVGSLKVRVEEFSLNVKAR